MQQHDAGQYALLFPKPGATSPAACQAVVLACRLDGADRHAPRAAMPADITIAIR